MVLGFGVTMTNDDNTASFRFRTEAGVITPVPLRGGELPHVGSIALRKAGVGSVGAWGSDLPWRPADRLLEEGRLLKKATLRDAEGDREVDVHLVKVAYHKWCAHRERWVSTVQWGEGIAMPDGGWAVPALNGHRWMK
jgi:hypothetical protein